MKKAIAIVYICIFSFGLFANQIVKVQTENTEKTTQVVLENLLTIAQYEKEIADKKVPWETDEEFKVRIKKDSEAIQLTRQMDAFKKELSKEEYRIGFDKTVVMVLPFDAENKQFPIEIISKDDLFPFHAILYYKITATEFEAIGREYTRIDSAYKANAMVASIGYTVIEKFPQIWEIAFTSLSLYDQLENDSKTQGLIATYQRSELERFDEDSLVKLQDGTIVPLYAVVPITAAFPKDASILVDGKVIGTGTAAYEISYETYSHATKNISIALRSKTGDTVQTSIALMRGLNPSLEIALARVGDVGPAGGYVFYDKGSYRDGWRYLEAAPEGWSGFQEDPGYFFEVGDSIRGIGTSTAIGSGKANTAALVKVLENQTSASSNGNRKFIHAAKVASDYTIKVDGVTYNDWFLPSKSELNEMYLNLRNKNLGGFYYADYYWSSSKYSDNYGWGQDFRSGSQHYINPYGECRVRPVRAF